VTQRPEAQTRILLTPGSVPPRHARGADKKEILPALVYFHGGGWTIGDLDTHDVLCRQFANGARCEVFSVEYRLAPECPFPAAVDDCIAATVRCGDRVNRMAVGGDSAAETWLPWWRCTHAAGRRFASSYSSTRRPTRTCKPNPSRATGGTTC
jgi:hypothetical protein